MPLLKRMRLIEDIAEEYYWLGVMNAMDWAPGSRNDWDYVDGEEMPKDEKIEF